MSVWLVPDDLRLRRHSHPTSGRGFQSLECHLTFTIVWWQQFALWFFKFKFKFFVTRQLSSLVWSGQINVTFLEIHKQRTYRNFGFDWVTMTAYLTDRIGGAKCVLFAINVELEPHHPSIDYTNNRNHV